MFCGILWYDKWIDSIYLYISICIVVFELIRRLKLKNGFKNDNVERKLMNYYYKNEYCWLNMCMWYLFYDLLIMFVV